MNPYQSPETASLSDLEPGIGVWRDGDYIVMHTGSALPYRCVKTGEPASWVQSLTLRWFQGAIPWRLAVGVPLTWQSLWRCLGLPVVTFFGSIAVTALAVWIMSILNDESMTAILIVLGLTIVDIVTGFRALSAFGRLLNVHRSRGDYLWLTGGSREFLSQLPEWQWNV